MRIASCTPESLSTSGSKMQFEFELKLNVCIDRPGTAKPVEQNPSDGIYVNEKTKYPTVWLGSSDGWWV